MPLSELLRGYEPVPQLQLSVRVRDKSAAFSQELISLCERIKSEEGCVRVNVRPSGTEPVIRVMAEAEDEERCGRCLARIARYLRDM